MPKHIYPASGWLPEHASLSMQRDDQGKDFVTNWKGAIQAPGNGRCVLVGSDRAFPNGFGPRYPVIEVTTGPFAAPNGHPGVYYLGHTTAAVSAGEQFSFGHVLSHADQGHPSQIGISVPGDGGWVELGEWIDGPLPNVSSHWYDGLLEKPLIVKTPDRPLKFGDKGLRVLGMTSRLRDCGWLGRPFWHFNVQVHGAVVAFKGHHRIPLGKPDGGIVDHRTDIALSHAAQFCRRHHRKEH